MNLDAGYDYPRTLSYPPSFSNSLSFSVRDGSSWAAILSLSKVWRQPQSDPILPFLPPALSKWLQCLSALQTLCWIFGNFMLFIFKALWHHLPEMEIHRNSFLISDMRAQFSSSIKRSTSALTMNRKPRRKVQEWHDRLQGACLWNRSFSSGLVFVLKFHNYYPEL